MEVLLCELVDACIDFDECELVEEIRGNKAPF